MRQSTPTLRLTDQSGLPWVRGLENRQGLGCKDLMPGKDGPNLPQLTLHKFICATDVSEHLKDRRVGEALRSSSETVPNTRLSREPERCRCPGAGPGGSGPTGVGGAGSQVFNELLQGIQLQPLISPASP